MELRTWGRLLAWAAVMAVLGLLPLVVGWSNLPDPLAIHWGIGGSPDNAWPKNAAALLPISMVAIGLFTSSLFRIESKPTAEAFAMIGLMAGLGLSLMASLVYLNWDAPTWQEAWAFTWWQLAAVLATGALGAWIGYVMGIRRYPRPETSDSVAGRSSNSVMAKPFFGSADVR